MNSPTSSSPAMPVDLSRLHCVADFESAAEKVLDPGLFAYIRRTAGNGDAHKRSISAFDSYGIVDDPDSEVLDPCTQRGILGTYRPVIGIAPTAWHSQFAPEGEAATAAAALSTRSLYSISCFSSLDYHAIARKTRYQLQHCLAQFLLLKDNKLLDIYLGKAYGAGCGGIILTIDALKGCRMCKADPTKPPAKFPKPTDLPLLPMWRGDKKETFDAYYDKYMPDRIDWGYIAHVVKCMPMPVILKGVLTTEHVEQALACGVEDVIVSNHGGRQDDDAPGTLTALAELVAQYKSRMNFHLDGGIRTGADIFKALAVGAKSVFIGRQVLYALAVGGQAGVQQLIALLDIQLKHTMCGAGCARIEDITPDKVLKIG